VKGPQPHVASALTKSRPSVPRWRSTQKTQTLPVVGSAKKKHTRSRSRPPAGIMFLSQIPSDPLLAFSLLFVCAFFHHIPAAGVTLPN
jgi:hypothetical protein